MVAKYILRFSLHGYKNMSSTQVMFFKCSLEESLTQSVTILTYYTLLQNVKFLFGREMLPCR